MTTTKFVLLTNNCLCTIRTLTTTKENTHGEYSDCPLKKPSVVRWIKRERGRRRRVFRYWIASSYLHRMFRSQWVIRIHEINGRLDGMKDTQIQSR